MPRVFVLQAFLFAGLRRLSRFYPVKNEALRLARKCPGQYECAACKKLFKVSDVVVDHIDPVIDPQTGFRNWDDYINRLFCPLSNLQVLDRECHSAKTKAEVKVRKATRIAKKAAAKEATHEG
jgi:5-methylcytosine-specific restriction endonuclease McrA